MIELAGFLPAEEQAWLLLFELAEANDSDWLLIGGQMMFVLAVEHGTQLPRPTTDLDLVVDVRALPGGTRWLASWLTERGFEQDPPSADGVSHRFTRLADPGPGQVVVDILGPEGLGSRASLTTVPPGYTVQTPGATQGFQRSELVDVELRVADGQLLIGRVRRPNLLGALVLKSEATTLPVRTNPGRDWQDCALLLSMAPDPHALKAELTRKDRQRLKRLEALRDRTTPRMVDAQR
jgi:hypothetical protein